MRRTAKGQCQGGACELTVVEFVCVGPFWDLNTSIAGDRFYPRAHQGSGLHFPGARPAGVGEGKVVAE